MLLTTDFFQPLDLSLYARIRLREYPQNQPSLARYLPYNPIDDIEFRLTRGDNGLVQLAPFRTFETESSIAGRRGLSRVTGDLPPISRKRVLGELDRLRRRKNPDASLEAEIFGAVDDLVEEIAMSFEVEMGQALTFGTVTPPGLNEAIDFGRDAAHSVTANVLWSSTSTSDPIKDLKTWAKAYRQKNGTSPGSIIMSEDQLTNMLESLTVRALASNMNGTPTIIDEAILNTILGRNRLPAIETYEVTYNSGTKDSPVTSRVIPNNVVILAPAPGDPTSPQSTKLGGTIIGAPSETEDERYQLVDSAAGIVAANLTQDDPPATWTRVSAIGLATLANPDLTFKAVVA